jgi:hypothetical protein
MMVVLLVVMKVEWLVGVLVVLTVETKALPLERLLVDKKVDQ